MTIHDLTEEDQRVIAAALSWFGVAPNVPGGTNLAVECGVALRHLQAFEVAQPAKGLSAIELVDQYAQENVARVRRQRERDEDAALQDRHHRAETWQAKSLVFEMMLWTGQEQCARDIAWWMSQGCPEHNGPLFVATGSLTEATAHMPAGARVWAGPPMSSWLHVPVGSRIVKHFRDGKPAFGVVSPAAFLEGYDIPDPDKAAYWRAMTRSPETEELGRSIAIDLNRVSRENDSNTPDFVLADFMLGALEALERAIVRRDEWYGISPRPGSGPPEWT